MMAMRKKNSPLADEICAPYIANFSSLTPVNVLMGHAKHLAYLYGWYYIAPFAIFTCEPNPTTALGRARIALGNSDGVIFAVTYTSSSMGASSPSYLRND